MALGHVDQVLHRRSTVRAGPVVLVVEEVAQLVAEAHPGDDLLNDRCQVNGRPLEGPRGDAATAGLLTRELGAVEYNDARSGPGQVKGRGTPGRPRPNNSNIETRHASS